MSSDPPAGEFDQQAAEARTAARPAARRAVTVLLVEDNPVHQMMAAAVLKERGYEVVVAKHGVEALEYYEQRDFAFILMDVQMPEMDGIEATRQIRAIENDRIRRVPILAVTALTTEGDRERCLEAGMDEYFVKPLDPAALDDAITRYVIERPRDFELDRALELVAGDEDLLADVVKLFLEETPQSLAAIHVALDRRDRETLKAKAYNIEGSANRLAMPRLRAVAHRIAVLSHRGEFEEAAGLMAELDAAVGRGASAVRGVIGSA